MREYGSVHTRFWTDPDIQQLSDQEKLLALYLLTGPHTNMLGCFRLPNGYVSEDLRWSIETVSKGFKELSEICFLTRDEDTSWILIHNFLKWNPIENPKQGIGIQRLFEQVPKNSLVFRCLTQILQRHFKHLPDTFKTCLETLSKQFLNQDQDQEQDQNQENIFMSGKPDVVLLSEENNFNQSDSSLIQSTQAELKAQAVEVLKFLNQKTGRTYREVETNLKFIIARLRSGATVMDCRQVIAKKTREWKSDPKMSEYLRPATLFNATKFEQYFGELLPEEEETP